LQTTTLAHGWQYETDANEYWKEVDGEAQVSKDVPEGCGPLGVIAVANAIKDMGALSSLNLANNAILSKESGRVLADALKTNSVLSELDLSDNQDKYSTLDGAGFAKELAAGISDNVAMTSLNLALNGLGAEGAKIVAEAIKVTMCTPATILVPFSCPSDFSINCCCLLLSPGYGGPIRHQCHGQPHRQGAARQAPGDNAL
jgi:hypothetical protein